MAYVLKDREDGEEENRNTLLRKRKNYPERLPHPKELRKSASSFEEEDEKQQRIRTEPND